MSEGDHVVSRSTLAGSHRGRHVTLPGITISRFEANRIVEHWTVSDNVTLLRQVGLLRSIALVLGYDTRRTARSR